MKQTNGRNYDFSMCGVVKMTNYERYLEDNNYFLSKHVIETSNDFIAKLDNPIVRKVAGSVYILTDTIEYRITDNQKTMLATWKLREGIVLRTSGNKLKPYDYNLLDDMTMEECEIIDQRKPVYITLVEEIKDYIGSNYRTSDDKIISDHEIMEYFYYWSE
jgi:hypothetical protein